MPKEKFNVLTFQVIPSNVIYIKIWILAVWPVIVVIVVMIIAGSRACFLTFIVIPIFYSLKRNDEIVLIVIQLNCCNTIIDFRVVRKFWLLIFIVDMVIILIKNLAHFPIVLIRIKVTFEIVVLKCEIVITIDFVWVKCPHTWKGSDALPVIFLSCSSFSWISFSLYFFSILRSSFFSSFSRFLRSFTSSLLAFRLVSGFLIESAIVRGYLLICWNNVQLIICFW